MENQRTGTTGISTIKACKVLHSWVHILADQYDLHVWPNEPRITLSEAVQKFAEQLMISSITTSKEFREFQQTVEKAQAFHWDGPNPHLHITDEVKYLPPKNKEYGPKFHDKRKHFRR